MAENYNPNTPKCKKRCLQITTFGPAYALSPCDKYASPSAGKHYSTTTSHGSPISTINPDDNGVKRAKLAMQEVPQESPQGIGVAAIAYQNLSPVNQQLPLENPNGNGKRSVVAILEI